MRDYSTKDKGILKKDSVILNSITHNNTPIFIVGDKSPIVKCLALYGILLSKIPI